PFLTESERYLLAGDGRAGVLGIFFLVIDVFLPVPSSLVMTAHGALFGVLGGTLLSMVGNVGAGLVGFGLGRGGEGVIRRWVTEEEMMRANELLARWGGVALIATRPIPLLAETTAIMAGASSMSWGQLLVATSLGSVPMSFLYALTGATAMSFNNTVVMFTFMLMMMALFWWLNQRLVLTAEPVDGIR
ncbi:MAG TPA: VTT domain-containing protein, partial [Anaerolineae bacterium]|nr:VTT domain-containing protein [Anaerolineae bacterium]